MSKMSVNLAGVTLKNPVMTASGTFGSGAEYSEFVDLNNLGAVVTKGVANVPWPGNPTPRVAETTGGMPVSYTHLDVYKRQDAGLPFEDVVSVVNKYIEEQHTFFVLENLETLRKNGRLSRVKALVATALKIKPIMGTNPEGTICQLDQARGMNKALVKMVDKIVEVTENSENKICLLYTSRCV